MRPVGTVRFNMGEFINQLIQKARQHPVKIAFPESGEVMILKAAAKVFDLGAATPVLIGNQSEIEELAKANNVPTNGFMYMDPADEALKQQIISDYMTKCPDLTEKTLNRKLKNPLNYGAAIVRAGFADCLACGFSHTTADVVIAAQELIGLLPGGTIASSMGIAEFPEYRTSEGHMLVHSDSAMNPSPTGEELAEIAINTCDTVAKLLGWEPRAALLSFSTMGSGEHPSIQKVSEAVRIANERRPDLAIEGEFQLDAALNPATAAKKVRTPSKVAGKANIIIYPDLNSGNTGVKSMQLFGNALSYGPILQGFNHPVTDFSRSAPLDEIVGNLVMLAVRAQSKPETK